MTGCAIVVAIAARKTSVAVLVPLIGWWLQSTRPWPERWRQVAAATGGGLLIAIPWFVSSQWWYGSTGLWQASGVGYVQIIWQYLHGVADTVAWGGGWHWVATTTIRTTAPLLAVLMLALVSYIASSTRSTVIARASWLIAASSALGWAALQRDADNLPQQYLCWFWVLVAGLYGWHALRPEQPVRSVPPSLLPVGAWLVALVGLYTLWPTFLVEYVPDFLLPATLLATAGITVISRLRWPLPLAWLIVLLIGVGSSYVSAYTHPWTGMFTRDSIYQTAALLQRSVPVTEPIFTAAVIIPYVSGHSVPHNVAHPLWYRYQFIDPTTQQTYLPPPAEIEDWLTEQAHWLLTEQLTVYAYLTNPAPAAELEASGWQSQDTIVNTSSFRRNPITLWHRVPAR